MRRGAAKPWPKRDVNPSMSMPLDLHLVGLLVLLVPIGIAALRMPWTAVAVGLIPQFLVFTKVSDYRRMGKHWVAYLFSNELLIGAVVVVSSFLDRSAS